MVLEIESVALDDEHAALVLLDQTLLPNETRFLHLTDQAEIWEAIHQLRVRGAPAIGIAAAYGLYLAVRPYQNLDFETFLEKFKHSKTCLASSRPTAVNLFWALNRLEACVFQHRSHPVPEIVAALRREADQIKAQDAWVCRSIGEYALALLQPGMGLLTHCNAGTLATARYGTALAPIYLGQERGYHFKVYADETRPLLQGARLTTYELQAAGVDVTLICDNMAATVMANGWVQAVLVGCDRVAANGDAANKIGTCGVAILAHYYGIPFYVCAPTSTIDLQCSTGKEIQIELRSPDEITKKWYAQPMAPEGVHVYNPAFDITDHSLITAIITEYGTASSPYPEALAEIYRIKADHQASHTE